MGCYPPSRFVCGRGALVVSVGRNQECAPACCTLLRYNYMNLLFVLENDRYLHVWYYPVVYKGSSKVCGCFLLCNLLVSFRVR
jgi:hypothetical protein